MTNAPHRWMGLAILILGSLQFAVAPAFAKDNVSLGLWDDAVYDSIDNPTADSLAHFRIRPGAVWETSAGSYRFDSGTLTFQSRVGGRPTGCYFEGTGSVHFEPPTAIERGQLHRFCKDSILDLAFTKLYCVFFDSATASGLDACVEGRATASLPRNGELNYWQERADDDLLMGIASEGWLRLLSEPMPNSYLIITGTFKDQAPLYFGVDDRDVEAVSLWRRPTLLVGKGELDLVCSFDRRRTPEEADNRTKLLYGGISIVRYDSDITIKPSSEMVLDVTLTVLPKRDSLSVVSLRLAPDLEVDSVWINGTPADFVYYSGGGGLRAKAGQAPLMQDSTKVRLFYGGKDLLYKFMWGDFFINYTTSWLPVAKPRERAHFATSFRFPKHYELVSSGELVSDTIDGDWRIKKWRTYDPCAFISFNYGSFDVLSSPVVNGPRLDIYRSENHPEGLFGGDIKKAVAADIEGSIRLFSESFGEYPWPQLAATEIPGIHGQGFPQLLHLAWFSFETSQQGVTDQFRAHEVAHQWFGHLVGWKTYHDQWLSEGFAEYAGAMYVQARNPGSKTFLDLVKQWRSDILDVGGFYGWHAGASVAPIWLGPRCASAASPASYLKLVYSKGAYVLHMLRNMLHDYRTGSDARFLAILRDYVSTHAHDDATTTDFQLVIERHLGQSMQWFFDQWVYGVQIPRYEYSWKLDEEVNGKWIVEGTIDQLEVDSTFRVFMPITLVFKEGRRTFVQEIEGTTATFRTPPLDIKPKDVIFNDYLTVLCREKVVSKP